MSCTELGGKRTVSGQAPQGGRAPSVETQYGSLGTRAGTRLIHSLSKWLLELQGDDVDLGLKHHRLREPKASGSHFLGAQVL